MSPVSQASADPDLNGAAQTNVALRGRMICAAILLSLLCGAAFFRCDHLGKQSLWLDEYWALYLATGRGNLIFNLPLNTVIWSPPAVGFIAAPHWWHIWRGLGSVLHPPLYYLLLRFWVNIFGDGDLAVRALSVVLGLGCVAMIFDLARRSHGQFVALAAAAMMALADIQIDLAQDARPYTLVVLLGLIVCESIILIEQRGLSPLRLAMLGLGVLCLALTHYFALGTIGGVALYALIRYRGRQRMAVVLTIAGTLLVVAAAWAPVAWRTRHGAYLAGPDFGVFPGQSLGRSILEAPRRLLANGADSRLMIYAPAFLVYILPLLKLRKNPRLLLWWLWTVCTVGLIAAIDVTRGSELVSVGRYIVVASPAAYILLATSFERGLSRCVPLALVAAALVFGIARWRSGSDFVRHTAAAAPVIHKNVRPHDGVVIVGNFDCDAAFRYVIIAHYAGDWKNPVLFLTGPLSGKLNQQLVAMPAVWVIGHNPSDMRLFPNWKIAGFHSVEPGIYIWKIVRFRS